MKTLALALAAVTVVGSASFAPEAEAGFRGGFRFGIGAPMFFLPKPSYTYRAAPRYERPIYVQPRRHIVETETESRKTAKPARKVTVAKPAPKAEPKQVATKPALERVAAAPVEVAPPTAVTPIPAPAAEALQEIPAIAKPAAPAPVDSTLRLAEPAKPAAPAPAAATKPLDCKQFIPSVSLTISVPCPDAK